ncbi:MAG: zinc/manganese transport system substrate-binding protein [Planctomycetota bacterium]|jgi:zinc/manganese transport system substrate-binding protein
MTTSFTEIESTLFKELSTHMRSTSARLTSLLFLLLALATPILAQEKLKVAATLPHLAEVCRAVGGDLVDVTSLAKPGEDPHGIKITPSMTGKVKEARLFIENGMTLESWSLRLLESSKNNSILPGQGGHVYATNGIIPLEKPSKALLESGAHVHAAGNPHVWLDPMNLKIAARNIEIGLARSLYKSKDQLQKNRIAFEKKIDVAMFGEQLIKLFGAKRLESLHRTGKLLPFLNSKSYKGKKLKDYAGGFLGRAYKLKSRNIISYHRTWSYFENAFGVNIVATLESKPGIPPSPTHLDKLKKVVVQENVKIVTAPIYYPKSRIEGFANQVGCPLVILPTQPGEAGAPNDLIKMYDFIFTSIEKALDK